MSQPHSAAAPAWPGPDTSRIPFWAYTRPDLYQRELERLFYQGHWCYVGLEAEIPQAGDFRRSVIGERSVIMVRDTDGGINVVENVCAHRGMRFCRERHGRAQDFLCPYHQWNYSLKGDLQGVPFRRGVKQDGQVQGGMPKDFKPEEHGLTRLKVACRGGVVFASFDHAVESLEDYLALSAPSAPRIDAPGEGSGASSTAAAGGGSARTGGVSESTTGGPPAAPASAPGSAPVESSAPGPSPAPSETASNRS